MQMSGALIDLEALSNLPEATYPWLPTTTTMARGGWKTGSPPGKAIRQSVVSPPGTGRGLVNNPTPIESVWHHEVMSLVGRNVFHNGSAIPVQYLAQMGPPVPVSVQPVIYSGDVWRDSMPGVLGR